jgi:mono/diheme cytochrome c family protein
MKWSSATLLAVLIVGGAAGSEPPPEVAAKLPPAAKVVVAFYRDIEPIFARHCYSCHGPAKPRGGLRLDDKTAALAGGDSGPALQPGQSAASELVRRVAGIEPDKTMPLKGDRLTPEQVGLIRAWIDQGAVWPDRKAAVAARSDHWSFLPRRRPAVPAVANQGWVRNPIDAFVLHKLEGLRIAPAPEADRPTLIRRLSLDLLGLPPALAEVEAFVHDRRPDAYEHLVDRLLASPHYGERWGRHWLDLARYADSNGYDNDEVRPFAWRYRDWVIDAFNRDLPFDQFTIEQLAGDLLPNATLEQKVATGFHRNTPTNTESGFNKTEEFRVRTVADRVSTTGTVWLGLTIGCCQCHTHKYDPLTQTEYYGLFAFFNNAEEKDLPAPLPGAVEAYRRAKAAFDREHAALRAAVADYGQDGAVNQRLEWEQVLRTPGSRRTVDPQLVRLSQALADHARKAPAYPSTQVLTMAENPRPRKTHVLLRGDYLRKGAEVQPHTFAVLPPLPRGGQTPNRLDLARWLVDPANPLTARVAVNRMWQHLFGRGLVATVEDFGAQGERPSHPELLDWLATEFIAQGWSQKAILKRIVTSATYQQSSQLRPELLERDPNNALLARQNRFRVEGEILRDLSLAVSGLLYPAVGGPSFRPPVQTVDGNAEVAKQLAKWKASTGPQSYRRGMYIAVQRTVPHPLLATFDAPDSHVACTRRDRSNTPLQALALLNDSAFFDCAQALGRRILRESPGDPAGRIRFAFGLCLARPPNDLEAARLAQLVRDQLALCRADEETAAGLAGTQPLSPDVSLAEAAAWVGLARTLLNLDEFITRE